MRIRVLVAVSTALISCAIVVAVSIAAVQGQTSDVPAVDFIAASLHNQAQSVPSLEVWWKADGGETDYHYVRTREMMRVDAKEKDGKTRHYSYDRNTLEQRGLITSADGVVNAGSITTGRIMDPFCQRNHFDTLNYILYQGEQQQPNGLMDQIKQGTVMKEKELVDGYSCWRVDVPAPETLSGRLEKQVVWLDPDIDFCPRRIEFLWKDQIPGVVAFKDYQEVASGVWFPNVQVISWPSDDGKTPYTINNKVSKVQAHNILTKDDLQVKFPSGTHVRNEALDAEYTQP